MAKYITEVELNKPIDVVSMVMEDYTYHERYIRADWNGEMVFMQEGTGRYLLWYYAAGILHIEAWKKGPFGGEAGPGPAVIAELSGLVARIRKQDEGKIAGGHIGSDPLHHDSNHQDNHTTWKQDTAWQGHQTQAASEKASTGLGAAPSAGNTLAIPFVVWSFAFSFMAVSPVFSIILCSVAKKMCKGKKTGGFVVCSVLSSLVMIVAIVVLLSGILAGFMNDHFLEMISHMLYQIINQ